MPESSCLHYLLPDKRYSDILNKLCGGHHNMRPPLQVDQAILDPLTLKVVSKSRATWAISVPILIFLGLCSRLRPDVRDRQADRRQIDRQTDRQTSDAYHRLMPPTLGAGHNKLRCPKIFQPLTVNTVRCRKSFLPNYLNNFQYRVYLLITINILLAFYIILL